MTLVQQQSPLTHFKLIASDIKLAHSVFALPFALLGAFMAGSAAVATAAEADASARAWFDHLGGPLVLIILAMVFARTCAMLANRMIDREIDRRNPRTRGRAIPSGRLPLRSAVATIAASTIGFLAVCVSFGVFFQNWWPAILGVPVLGWLMLYPFTKRLTWMCHVYLGSSLALSPLAAAIAVHPPAVLEQSALWLLGVFVLLWVAGFDIIYALQDVDIDIEQELHSVPQRFGTEIALRISRVFHVIAWLCLLAIVLIDDRFGLLLGSGVAIVGILLLYEQATVRRWGTTRIALAFFTLNGIISCVLGGLGILDLLV